MALSHAILAVLSERPQHGYAVYSSLDRLIGSFWPVNRGQVYATLERLLRKGLVERATPSPGRNDTPHRRYGLSPRGCSALDDWLRSSGEAEGPEGLGFDDWIAHLAICAQRDDRLRLNRTLDTHRLRCESLRRGLSSPTGSKIDQVARDLLDAELAWLNRAKRELLPQRPRAQSNELATTSQPGEVAGTKREPALDVPKTSLNAREA